MNSDDLFDRFDGDAFIKYIKRTYENCPNTADEFLKQQDELEALETMWLLPKIKD